MTPYVLIVCMTLGRIPVAWILSSDNEFLLTALMDLQMM